MNTLFLEEYAKIREKELFDLVSNIQLRKQQKSTQKRQNQTIDNFVINFLKIFTSSGKAKV